MTTKYKLVEIFKSIQGEGYNFGKEVVFIRFCGCNLKCPWCFGTLPDEWTPQILTYDGETTKLKGLPQIKVGDQLLTFDDSHNPVLTTVKQTLKHEVDKARLIVIGPKKYFVTDEHPFFTERGLVKAKNLKPGDKIINMTRKERFDWEKNQYKFSHKMNYLPDLHNHPNCGDSNGNRNLEYKMHNFDVAKRQLKAGAYSECEVCGSNEHLLVHHIDENRSNDSWDNFAVMCKHCHDKLHKRGNNFSNILESDYIVKSNDPIKPTRSKFVYNLSCEPYNSYIIDGMYVHNCDTNVNECNFELTAKQIKDYVDKLGCKNIILTGGEPTIQDLDTLLKEFNKEYWIGIETNGLREVPDRINWVSCSPKFHFRNIELKLQNPLIYKVNKLNNPMFKEGEFRLVVDDDSEEFINWAIKLQEKYSEHQLNIRWYLSPCEIGNWKQGETPKFDWEKLSRVYNILKNRSFKISIQIHKLWGKR